MTSIRIALAALLVSATGAPAAQCFVERLTAGDPESGDNFGASIDLDGDRLAVGVWGDDDDGQGLGSVRVFERALGGWTQIAHLTSGASGPAFDYHGLPVAISGGVVVSGSRYTDGLPGKETGAAYVWEEGPGGWSLAATLAPSNLEDGDQFGDAVAVEGDTIMVSATRKLPESIVYVYRRQASGWLLEQQLRATGESLGAQLGSSIAIDGDRVLLGASGDSTHAFLGGAAFVFERWPIGWVQTARLDPLVSIDFGVFGFDVDLDGDRAIIANPQGTGPFAGAAWIFEESGGTWTATSAFTPDDAMAGDHFSEAVAIDGDRVLIGAWLHDGAGTSAGAAYVYDSTETGWVQRAKIEAPFAGSGAYLGTSVDLDGTTAVVGAPGLDLGGTDSGAVYRHHVPLGPSLLGCPIEASLAVGDRQTLELDAGSEHAGRVFLLLGSASGTSPGLPLDGLNVPLNVDAYTFFSLENANQPPFGNTFGVLDGEGRATSMLTVAPGTAPSLVGVELNHAFAVMNVPGPGDALFASDPVPLSLLP